MYILLVSDLGGGFCDTSVWKYIVFQTSHDLLDPCLKHESLLPYGIVR